jgi:gamma-glutamylcyclotransferase (GGCT)/AIG2-like uncharacterized protein YtfP
MSSDDTKPFAKRSASTDFTMKQSELVFAYGSNMDPVQIRERCPDSDLSWFLAEARGWRLCFPRHSNKRKGGVGSIVRSEDDSVFGVVFAVTKPNLTQLDAYEGVAACTYKRDYLDVFNSDGKSCSAWTYFAIQNGQNREFVPHTDYIALYIRGAEHFGLPAAYIQTLRDIRASRI